MVQGELFSATVGSNLDTSPRAMHEGAGHSISAPLTDPLRTVQQTTPTSGSTATTSIR